MSLFGRRLNDGEGISDTVGNWTIGGTLARVGCGVLAFIVVVSVIGVIGRFAFGWFNTGVQVFSPENVKAQYSRAYSDWTSLQATAGNVCQARGLVNQATDPSIKVQYQQQESAYEQNYRRIQADYNEAYLNAFEAKHVGPGDIPSSAPGLDAMLTTQGCAVTSASP